MTDLDATIGRLRALPKEEQDAIAAQINLMLDSGPEDTLTAEQWVEIEARIDSSEGFTPHEEVVRTFRNR